MHKCDVAHIPPLPMQTHYEMALESLKAAVGSLVEQYGHFNSGVVRLEVFILNA